MQYNVFVNITRHIAGGETQSFTKRLIERLKEDLSAFWSVASKSFSKSASISAIDSSKKKEEKSNHPLSRENAERRTVCPVCYR